MNRHPTVGFLVISVLWLLIFPGRLGGAVWPELIVPDPDGVLGRAGAPVYHPVTLETDALRAATENRLGLQEIPAGIVTGPILPVQFEPANTVKGIGRLWWLMPPGPKGQRVFRLMESQVAFESILQTRTDTASGQLDIREAGKLVLRYNYQRIEPGDLLTRVHPDNRKYARSRSDYIHPLCGPGGEELTKDWSVDHPHHRGIYWAWPEVDYQGERGDLHALQRVFARPTGQWSGQDGPVFAMIEAENLWRWEDQDPIVREQVIIRAYRPGPGGRCLDLEFHFTALQSEVQIARRGMEHYGGLNIRLAAVKDQQIRTHTDPPEANPRLAWADLFGTFSGGNQPVGLAIFQDPTNPNYPGDWIQYPELNWLQPTFPAQGTRYTLKKAQPLRLQFRLWIHWGQAASEAVLTDEGQAYHRQNAR